MRVTSLKVEFDRKNTMDSFDALIRTVKRAGVAVKAFASAMANLDRNVRKDLRTMEEFRKAFDKTEGGEG